MGRHAAGLTTMQRIRRALGGVAAVTVAFLTASVAGTAGTYAAWNDSALLIDDVTITSGAPHLEVEGFQSLNHEYTLLPLSISKTGVVTVTNLGNVPLHGFEATREAGEGLLDLLDAVTMTFTPYDGGTTVNLGNWLSGLTLAPQQSVKYTVTTSILSSALLGLVGQQVVTYIDVTAMAGTSWTTGDQDHFVQSVGTPVIDPEPDFNTEFVYPNYPAQAWPEHGVASFGLFWSKAGLGIPDDAHWLIFTDQYLVISDQGSYPQHSFSAQDIDPAEWPPVGQTKKIVITIKPNIDGWGGGVVAQRTMWMTNTDGVTPHFFPHDPAAPVAETAPETPMVEAPAPVPSPAPAPTPTPEIDPEPAPLPAPTPEETTGPEATPTPDPEPSAEPAPPEPEPAPTPTAEPEAVKPDEIAPETAADTEAAE